MDITDTAYSLLLISEESMQQDTADHLERLMLTSDRGMNKVLNLLAGITLIINFIYIYIYEQLLMDYSVYFQYTINNL